ncbi:MAG: hypothetical protein PHH48_09110 [Eubacteriales bacterium]|nr:hypothetical protein [Eubacteriales bacterium]
MSEDIRYEAEAIKRDRFIDCNKLNCKSLVYNKRLSGKFRLYLSDKGAYKKAFELIAKKRFTHH